MMESLFLKVIQHLPAFCALTKWQGAQNGLCLQALHSFKQVSILLLFSLQFVQSCSAFTHMHLSFFQIFQMILFFGEFSEGFNWSMICCTKKEFVKSWFNFSKPCWLNRLMFPHTSKISGSWCKNACMYGFICFVT